MTGQEMSLANVAETKCLAKSYIKILYFIWTRRILFRIFITEYFGCTVINFLAHTLITSIIWNGNDDVMIHSEPCNSLQIVLKSSSDKNLCLYEAATYLWPLSALVHFACACAHTRHLKVKLWRNFSWVISRVSVCVCMCVNVSSLCLQVQNLTTKRRH